jgi:hypothetical protein
MRIFTRTHALVTGLVVFAAAATVAAAYTIPSLYGGKGSTCFWNIGVVNPHYINIALADTNANYWAAVYTEPAGATLALKGEYPYARYMALQAYNSLAAPVDAIADYQINPDPGSSNPFRAGVRRDVKRRSFTVTLLDSSPSAQLNPDQRNDEPARSYLRTRPIGDTSGLHVVMYRVFVPDKGNGLQGGVPLPKPVLRLANGRLETGQALCSALTSQVKRLPSPTDLLIPQSQYDAMRYQPGVPPWFPAKAPPVWRVQYNRAYLLALYDGPTFQSPYTLPLTKTGQSSFFPNLDVQYMRAALNRKLGKVVAFRGTMPTTPKTYDGETYMRQNTQVRYLSFCMNESVLTTRAMDCVYDEQIPLNKRRHYIVVTSRARDRPSNATSKCGVAWLAWSPAGDGGSDHDFGWMQLRNMLPSPSFHHAIQDTAAPGDEHRVLGSFLPTGTYYENKQAFEKLGCPVK